MEYIISIIIGILSGVLAAIIFLKWYLDKTRPLISVSPHICKMTIDGATNFVFKFVNNTACELYDVRVETTFYKPIGGVDGKNLRGKDIILVDDYMLHIPQKNEHDIHNLHAKWVRTTEDVETSWNDVSSFIRIKITAEHSLSGLRKIFVKDFDSKACITPKQFCSGDNLGVK